MPLMVSLSDCEITTSRSSGPGGQNVNKTNSKVTLTCDLAAAGLPADVLQRFWEAYHQRMTNECTIVISCDQTRDRLQNQDIALERLNDMIAEVWHPPKERKATRPTRSSQRKRVEGKVLRAKIKGDRRKIRDW